MESLDTTLSRLPIKHQQSLRWFVQNEGREFRVRKLLIRGAVTVIDPTCRFICPGWSEYLFSIRAEEGDSSKWNFDEYGAWMITVPLTGERISINDNDLMKALVLSWKDRVPIGVFKEVDNNFVVEGLGFVLEIKPDSVVLGSVSRNENSITRWRSTQEKLRQIALSVQRADAEVIKSTWLPPDSIDARKKVSAEVVQRAGQVEFRRALMKAYQSTCAITGSKVAPILEAAHIVPYSGEHTNDVRNGLLLRSDIHALFDLGLITIDENFFTICIHNSIKDSEYGSLHGKSITLPQRGEQRPSKEALKTKRRLSSAIESDRITN